MAKIKLLIEKLGIDYIDEIIKQSTSYSEVLKKLNCRSSRCFYTLKNVIEKYKIDNSHFLGKGKFGKDKCKFIHKLEAMGPTAIGEIVKKLIVLLRLYI